jgi:acyl-CoA synthetase (AMP-forming)/AMP-acid ligase II
MFDRPSIRLPDILALHARTRPQKIALIDPEGPLTWAAFDARCAAVAGALHARGIGRGHVVGVLAGLSSASVCAMFGVLRSGAAVASLSTAVMSADLRGMVVDSGARLVLADAAHREAMPGIETCALDIAGPEVPPSAGAEDDLFCLIYSSGTTGAPKGIALTHRDRLSYAYMLGVELGWTPDAVCLNAMALHSNTSWSQLLVSLLYGATTILLPKFNAATFCALARTHGTTHTILVPAQYAALLEQDAEALATLSTACTVGAMMAPAQKQSLIDALPGCLHEVYGLTEGLVTILHPSDLATHRDSVGRPMLGNDIRLIGRDDAEVPPGEPGEIVGYSPFLMRGYHSLPAQTEAAIWREPDSQKTFLRSGDIGRFDAEGFLHLVDRKKDMIISGGQNIYPADLERVLAAHPDVAEVCVIGIPHARWGETPLALVVPRNDPDVTQMRDWANTRLGRMQRLSAVEFRKILPRNAGGKFLKRDLRIPYWPQEQKP